MSEKIPTENIMSNAVLFHRKNNTKRQSSVTNMIKTHGKIDYKNIKFLLNFISPKGRIIPSRISGATRIEQTALCQAIKRARDLALLPFSNYL